jgi:hypothetical protein
MVYDVSLSRERWNGGGSAGEDKTKPSIMILGVSGSVAHTGNNQKTVSFSFSFFRSPAKDGSYNTLINA